MIFYNIAVIGFKMFVLMKSTGIFIESMEDLYGGSKRILGQNGRIFPIFGRCATVWHNGFN